jgi:hypothetical protein
MNAWARRFAPFPTLRLLMSRYRRLKIEGGAFFYALALAECGDNTNQLSERLGA